MNTLQDLMESSGLEHMIVPKYEALPAKTYVTIPYEQPGDDGTGSAIIFDIDNTLAIMGDRSPYDGSKVHIDTVNEEVLTALELYNRAGYDVLIVTGRDEKYREVTERWFRQNGIPWSYMYMRPRGDNREDSVIKNELFDNYIRNERYYIAGVFDDRHRVLRMWRALGLTTFHVNGPDSGNF